MALSFNGKEVNSVKFNNNVGYEVVGSPTIVDGVASNLNVNNYLKVNSWNQGLPFEFQIKFTTKEILASDTSWICRSNGFLFYILWNKKIALFLQNEDNQQVEMAGITTIQGNTTYWLKAVYTGSNFSFYLSTNGINYHQEYSNNFVASNNTYTLSIGDLRTDLYSLNSIDLNETYIKVNGITWFSGKEQASADVNYVIKDDKLIWANPNLYLRAPARQSVDDGKGTPIIDTGITITDYTHGIDLRYRAYELPFEGMLLLGNVQSYRYQTDRIKISGADTINFSKLINNSICRLVYDGLNNTVTLLWGDGTSETKEAVSGSDFRLGTQRLGSTWDRNTGFDYYHYKLFQNNNLIQHLVPVPIGLKIGDYTVPSNGMWDIVTQQFFGNSSTGEFSYGKDN